MGTDETPLDNPPLGKPPKRGKTPEVDPSNTAADSGQPDEFVLSGTVSAGLVSQLYPDALIVNLQGKIIYSSRTFCERFGKQKLTGSSLLEFIPLPNQKDLLFTFNSLDGECNPKRIKLNLISVNGTEYCFEVSIQKFYEEQTRPLIFITPVPSINSEQLQSEIHRLQSIIEQSPLSIVITDTQGNITYVNSQFERSTGYTRTEVLGQNSRLLKSGSTKKEVYQTLWNTITKGKTWKGELRNKRKNGDLFWELTSISCLTNDKGQITHYIAIKEDITVRKVIFERLAEGEERIRFIVEATGDVLYQFNYSDDRYEYMNPAIVQLTGYTVYELNQLKLSGIVQEISLLEGTHGNNLAAPKQIYGERGDYRVEYLIKTKNGGLKWIEDHSFPWYDDENFLKGSVGILSDITQRKETEHELMRAKSEAETMNRLKDVFLANMSHELRTPLISILGYADILKDITSDPETKDISDILHQSALRLTDTINMILDLSMLEVGNLYLHLNKVDLSEVLNKVCATNAEKAAKKNIEVLNKVEKATFFVEADQRILSQVFDNIVNNAVKYTSKGSVCVSAHIENDQVVVSVKDSGIGIKEEHFAIIFEEFRQVSEGLDRRYEGSGLGLNISKRFVEKMNGKIWVESEFGKGSVFHIALNMFKD